jgi:hypothetical protein
MVDRIYNYLSTQCLSSLMLWVRIPLRRGVLDTALCHQDQHSEQPPIISNAKRPSHLWHLDIHFLARDRHTYMTRLNRLMIVQPPFDNWISNDKIDIKKPWKKPAHIHFHLKWPHTTTKNNENINRDSAISLVNSKFIIIFTLLWKTCVIFNIYLGNSFKRKLLLSTNNRSETL